jgi:hypothetical protein
MISIHGKTIPFRYVDGEFKPDLAEVEAEGVVEWLRHLATTNLHPADGHVLEVAADIMTAQAQRIVELKDRISALTQDNGSKGANDAPREGIE